MMKKVLEYQRQLGLIEDGDRIVAGFSGGADSVCLLLVLEELKKYWNFDFCAIHVEHGIRGEESLADAAFAEAFCRERGIDFTLCHVDAPGVAAREGLSLEEAARKLRYHCFEQAKVEWNGNKIAVAHHADDNAETMLFHLARGTGLRGLGGIQPKRDGLIRPLLCVTRQEVEAYLKDRQTTFCTDSTNKEVQYSRNRIRLNVMPELELLNSKAVEHMSSVAGQLAEAYDYIARAAWEAGKAGLCGEWTEKDGWRLRKDVVNCMEPVLQREFLYQVLGKAAGSQKDIGNIHVENLRQLFLADTGKQTDLPYGLTAGSSYDQVWLRKRQAKEEIEDLGCAVAGEMAGDVDTAEIDLARLAENECECFSVAGVKMYMKLLVFDGDCEKIPEKTYTKWFDYDKIKDTVFVRKRRPGDYLMINQQGNQKKLKEYLINEKIPREQRDQLWLIADGPHVIWVVGHRISEGYKVTPQTKRILEIHVEEEK